MQHLRLTLAMLFSSLSSLAVAFGVGNYLHRNGVPNQFIWVVVFIGMAIIVAFTQRFAFSRRLLLGTVVATIVAALFGFAINSWEVNSSDIGEFVEISIVAFVINILGYWLQVWLLKRSSSRSAGITQGGHANTQTKSWVHDAHLLLAIGSVAIGGFCMSAGIWVNYFGVEEEIIWTCLVGLLLVQVLGLIFLLPVAASFRILWGLALSGVMLCFLSVLLEGRNDFYPLVFLPVVALVAWIVSIAAYYLFKRRPEIIPIGWPRVTTLGAVIGLLCAPLVMGALVYTLPPVSYRYIGSEDTAYENLDQWRVIEVMSDGVLRIERSFVNIPQPGEEIEIYFLLTPLQIRARRCTARIQRVEPLEFFAVINPETQSGRATTGDFADKLN